MPRPAEAIAHKPSRAPHEPPVFLREVIDAPPLGAQARDYGDGADWSLHARGLATLTWGPAFLAQQAALWTLLVMRGNFAAAAAVPRALLDAPAGKDPSEVRL